MKRIMIPTISQPDVPNVNQFVYSKKVWYDFITTLEGKDIRIPLILNQNTDYLQDGVPYDKIIGYVTKLSNTYVIADLIDYEERLKDNPLAIDLINEYINRIHTGKIKAYMNYLADMQIEPDMAFRYVDKIYSIIYFHLGNANPRDMRPFEFDPTKIKRHNKKRK